ncbi:hypothetical protein B0H11DRAFT_2227675 [Mycena galericulata]|nr:hypothetical protein B0H11DRAFT_2227675 [Mycena galericulata]
MSGIVIIGAGVGGLAFGIALKRQLGFMDFKIYTRRPRTLPRWWHLAGQRKFSVLADSALNVAYQDNIYPDALGVESSATAKILISAIGILEVPRFPSIPGLGSFKGEMFHSVRWHASVNLRGKRVAVIGNGVSATQFVPIISGDPSAQVTEFCRTPK